MDTTLVLFLPFKKFVYGPGNYLIHIESIIMNSFVKFIFIFLLISCGDDGPNCPGDMFLPINIGPYKPYYNLGDKIVISSKFNKLLFDEKTNRFYDVSNYKFVPLISMNTLDSANDYNWKSKINEICFFIGQDKYNMKQLSSGDESAIVGEYNFLNDTLEFEVKLILNHSGYFALSTESLSSGDGRLQNNYKFNCRGQEIKFELLLPNNNNIQLMQQFRSKERNNWILSDSINRYFNYAGYCFEVR